MSAASEQPVYVSPSETLSLLKRHGIWLRKGLGQHFLVDNNIILNILREARVEPSDVVLEVGPGIGSLTKGLADRASTVVAVEIDDRLADCFRENVTAPNVRLLRMDAFELEAGALPDDLDPNRLVANLPYNVAVPLFLRLLERLPRLATAVVMVQREVADRMAASPGTKSYGAVTVKLAYYGEVRRLFAVAPTVFIPPPRVDSAVVRFVRARSGDRDRELLFKLVDAAFAQRRKTLLNALVAGLEGLGKRRIEQGLRRADIDPGTRAERLTVDDYLRLADALFGR